MEAPGHNQLVNVTQLCIYMKELNFLLKSDNLCLTDDQKTKHARWEMYEFQKYTLHESIVSVLHCDSTSSVRVQTLA